MINTFSRTLKKLAYESVRVFIFMLCIVSIVSCQMTCHKLEPTICYAASQHEIEKLATPFSALSPIEKHQEWAKELVLGDAFARDFDFYRAITCYKRALILLPDEAIERQLQITYDIILCYYLGHKYPEAILAFEGSPLVEVNALFPAFNNLLLILYQCYQETGQTDKWEAIYEVIQKGSPETALDLILYDQIKEGDIAGIETSIYNHSSQERIENFLCQYETSKLSPKKARQLNAILPGAGYYYVGQKKAALTSFLINTLFIAATYQFFRRGYPAAGLITGSLETGWYLGGINGAGIEAQEYNNHLYNGTATKALIDAKLFPVLMFETSF